MPLTPLRYREIRRKLLKAGFTEVSQRGSHVRLVRYADGRKRTVVLPRHAKDIPVGTIKSIIHQAAMTDDEFMAL